MTCNACLRSGEVLPSPLDLIGTVKEQVKSLGLTLVIEPGRSLVATSGALINSVTGDASDTIVALTLQL